MSLALLYGEWFPSKTNQLYTKNARWYLHAYARWYLRISRRTTTAVYWVLSLYLIRKSKLAGHDGVTLILLLNFEPGLADTTARVCIVDVKNNERTQGFALLYIWWAQRATQRAEPIFRISQNTLSIQKGPKHGDWRNRRAVRMHTHSERPKKRQAVQKYRSIISK